jgi:hypothetical protein
MRRRPETYFVGPIWGLIDLKDPQASPALIQMLEDRRQFFELHGFRAMTGEAGAVAPLMEMTRLGAPGQRDEWAGLADQ